MRRTLVVIVAVVVCVAFAAPAAAKSWRIGDKAPSGDLKFIVHGFTDPWVATNQFDTPPPGTRYVLVDVEVINPRKEQQTFSSLLGFHLVTKDRRSYKVALTTADPPTPDGQIPPRFSVRGSAVFAVPDGAVPKTFRAQGNITASGALIKLKARPAPAP